jgi:prevent-host-death family protein
MDGQAYTKFCPNLVPPFNLEQIMDLSKRFHPISYLKTNTADVAKELQSQNNTVVVTQNGVPAFVCVNFEDYHQQQETNALLKLLSLGEKEKAAGQVLSLEEAMREMEAAIFYDEEEEVQLKAG